MSDLLRFVLIEPLGKPARIIGRDCLKSCFNRTISSYWSDWQEPQAKGCQNKKKLCVTLLLIKKASNFSEALLVVGGPDGTQKQLVYITDLLRFNRFILPLGRNKVDFKKIMKYNVSHSFKAKLKYIFKQKNFCFQFVPSYICRVGLAGRTDPKAGLTSVGFAFAFVANRRVYKY